MGGHLPNARFVFPLLRTNASTYRGSRYWEIIAAGAPDMGGGREQTVWFRFQQIECSGAEMLPPCRLVGRCRTVLLRAFSIQSLH